jgi:hypothetical protein
MARIEYTDKSVVKPGDIIRWRASDLILNQTYRVGLFREDTIYKPEDFIATSLVHEGTYTVPELIPEGKFYFVLQRYLPTESDWKTEDYKYPITVKKEADPTKMKIRIVVVESNDEYPRAVTVTTQPCEGYGFWNRCYHEIVSPTKGSFGVFTLPVVNTIYITISAPDESYYWKFDVYKDNNKVGNVTVKGGYKATAFNLTTGGGEGGVPGGVPGGGFDFLTWITKNWWIIAIILFIFLAFRKK